MDDTVRVAVAAELRDQARKINEMAELVDPAERGPYRGIAVMLLARAHTLEDEPADAER